MIAIPEAVAARALFQRVTLRQLEILTLVADANASGRSPTLRELADAVGVRSTHSIVAWLRQLARKGLVTRREIGIARSLVATRTGLELLGRDQQRCIPEPESDEEIVARALWKITAKQIEVLEILYDSNLLATSPSFRELCRDLGVTFQAVWDRVENLIAAGTVVRAGGLHQARSLRVTALGVRVVEEVRSRRERGAAS